MTQIRTGSYHGGDLQPGGFDRGHDKMRLDDFVDHQNSQTAKLDRVEVLSLRLYTSTSYPKLIEPLRNQQKPHPFATTVYHLTEGLRKLKAVRGDDLQRELPLCRGLANMAPPDRAQFEAEGGSERAVMSTSRDKSLALSFSARNHQVGVRILFKYMTKGVSRGASINYLSLYPDEQEHVYRPQTYLQPLRIYDEDEVTIIEVRPENA